MSNRERKMRAWCPDDKAMYYPDEDYSFRIYKDGSVSFQPHYENPELHYYSDNPCDGEKKIIAMDFTGLKDKNGKDIYEGDILSAERTVTGRPTKDGKCMEVFGGDSTDIETRTWKEKIVAEINISENEMIFRLPKEGGTYQERGKQLQWEIIGNIYEHPELIESK